MEINREETPLEVDYEDILREWSYRLPKGFPTVVNGQLTEATEIAILNQVLEERGLSPLSFQLPDSVEEAVISMGADPTDTKEGLVCMFIDAGLANPKLFDLYRSLLDKSLASNKRVPLTKKLVASLTQTIKRFAKHYKSDGIEKAPAWIGQTLRDVSKKTPELVTANNAVAAADAVVSMFAKLLSPGCVRRDATFNNIRKRAVQLVDTNYQIKGYPPDNWCPGDLYLLIDPARAAAAVNAISLNIGNKSLNAQFYGSSSRRAPIIAISLKQENAQAGKGTTFLKNVMVDGVTNSDKQGDAAETKALIKFRNVKRRLDKYYLKSDIWQKDAKVFQKVRAAIAALKIPGTPVKAGEEANLRKFMVKNKGLVQQTIDKTNRKLSKSLDVVATFQQAYTKFINNLRSKNIVKIEGDAVGFIKSIEQTNRQMNGGKLNLVTYNELLAQKAATYKLASVLMEKWTDKAKKISPAFAAHLQKVKNPFVAITLFAIAQHGLNPNFYKVVGRDNAAKGSVDEFPTNSQVDERVTADNLEIKDTPGKAGFLMLYNLAINKHVYRTTLTFRFASSTIRVEVERLEKVA